MLTNMCMYIYIIIIIIVLCATMQETKAVKLKTDENTKEMSFHKAFDSLSFHSLIKSYLTMGVYYEKQEKYIYYSISYFLCNFLTLISF